MRTLLRRFLAVPLVAKLVGANALILAGVAAAMTTTSADGEAWVRMLVALAVTFAVNILLVWIALRPLAELERTARRIEHGDFAARVPPSPLADRDMTRVGQTLDHLVDRLLGDRARMRDLASQVIRAQDEERSRVARELHDSTAQTLAAAMLHLRAITTAPDPITPERLDVVRDALAEAIEEVRTVAHTMYPRVLDDLGLAAALEWLAGRTRGAAALDVRVLASGDAGTLPPPVASVLYRVAQEALRNALQHSGGRGVVITLTVDERTARLEVRDDGRGLDDSAAVGMGVFAMRERVALVDGVFEIGRAPGGGTRVVATVPLAVESGGRVSRSRVEGREPRSRS